MPRWLRDPDGVAHHFTDEVAACDVIHDPCGPASERDPVCHNCIALVRPELGLSPSWMIDPPDVGGRSPLRAVD